YTFKRVHGATNEWEVTMWDSETQERISVARVFCNSQTTVAFELIWTEFFDAIEDASGKRGSCRAVLLDMEPAQVDGLGLTIVKTGMNDPAVSHITETLPAELVLFIIKLCSIHWERSGETLATHVPRRDVDFAMRIRGLSDPQDIAAWHDWCKNHPSQYIRNWYTQKVSHSWLLGGFNPALSKMDEESWKLSPSHTNLVESAHTATNDSTGINLPIVEAIRSAQKLDFDAAEQHQKRQEECLFKTSQNSLQKRFRNQVGRKTSRTLHLKSYGNVEDDIDIRTSEVDKDKKAKARRRVITKELKDAEGEKRAALFKEQKEIDEVLIGADEREDQLKESKKTLKEMGRRPKKLQRHPSVTSSDYEVPLVGAEREAEDSDDDAMPPSPDDMDSSYDSDDADAPLLRRSESPLGSNIQTPDGDFMGDVPAPDFEFTESDMESAIPAFEFPGDLKSVPPSSELSVDTSVGMVTDWDMQGFDVNAYSYAGDFGTSESIMAPFNPGLPFWMQQPMFEQSSMSMDQPSSFSQQPFTWFENHTSTSTEHDTYLDDFLKRTGTSSPVGAAVEPQPTASTSAIPAPAAVQQPELPQPGVRRSGRTKRVSSGGAKLSERKTKHRFRGWVQSDEEPEVFSPRPPPPA
ncbi:hypothetical protein BDZ89DRAFT_1055288, partial [Hymenopellis radicata]